jgi:opacity protein-like surface antigen
MLAYYNWTGFYVGGNVGGAWANGTLTDNLAGVSLGGNNSGFIGGIQAGYNWQVTPYFVLGVEGMYDVSSMNNSVTAGILNRTVQGTTNTNRVATIAGRLGIAQNNWLFYGKGGGGWAERDASVAILTTTGIDGSALSASGTGSGWLAGGGIEYGVTPNWTWRVEYDYLKLSDWTNSGGIIFPADTFTLRRQINMVTLGLNYKF